MKQKPLYLIKNENYLYCYIDLDNEIYPNKWKKFYKILYEI